MKGADYDTSSAIGEDEFQELSEGQSDSPSKEEEKKPAAPSNKKVKKTKKKAKLIVNVLNTQYDVIKEVAKKTLRYKLSFAATGEWDLFWADTGVTSEMLTKMKPYQKINHYPSTGCLARKNNLGKNLMRMRKSFPKDYNFFPPTWLLPLEYNEFRAQFTPGKLKTFIVKPEALSQGKGIYLIRSPEELDPNEHCVVQRYLRQPYLIDGLKFDLRIYVLIYGCDPLRIYIFKEGLARLATEEYQPPTRDNLDNLYVHLTNYAINKNSDNFVFNTDPNKADVGHKRSLNFVWSYIDSHGGNSRILQRKIKRCIVKTFCAVQPQFAHSYRTCQPNDIENNMCFEILGFDILLDHKLKPWLIEVNHSPSFTTDTPFDHKVKHALLLDTFRILHMDINNRTKYYQQKQDEFNSRALGKGRGKLSREEKEELRKQAMIERDKYELENCGGFSRIYPDPKMDAKYSEFIAAAEQAWQEFYGFKKKPVAKDNDKKSKVLPKPPTKSPNIKPYVKKPVIETRARASSKPPTTSSTTVSNNFREEKTFSLVHPEDEIREVPKKIASMGIALPIRGRETPGLLEEICRAKLQPKEMGEEPAFGVYGKKVIGTISRPAILTQMSHSTGLKKQHVGNFKYGFVVDNCI